jgi:CelD/BcsL family acetyltransferase involved in cellulose biosynthesis
LGPLLAPGYEAAAAAALAEKLLRLAQFDVLELTDLDSESAFAPAMERASRQAGLACTRERAQRIVFVDLPGDWQAFLGSLSAQRRQRIRRLRRKLAARHPTRFFVWRDANSLDRAVDELARLHRKRWQGTGASESFASAQYLGFHRGVVKACFMRGWLRLYCLQVGGQLVAMLYTYRFRNRIYLMQAGFDPAYASFSIGFVLLGHALEHAIQEGNEVFDFLRGEHRYKDELATGCRETLRIMAWRSGPRALAYRLQCIYAPAWKAKVRALVGACVQALFRPGTSRE